MCGIINCHNAAKHTPSFIMDNYGSRKCKVFKKELYDGIPNVAV
jgi:hypothetical protein